MRKKKMLFIYNPCAGKGAMKSKLSDVMETFMRADYEVTVYATQREREATELVMELGEKYDRIVCSGGDGTLHEVTQGLMNMPAESRPVCGYIPTGTVNDFARSLKIPRDMVKAARLAVFGKDFLSDVGTFNNSHFVYIAAFGIFTDVAYSTPQDMKNVLGNMAYLLEGVKRLANIPSYHLKFSSEECSGEGDFIFGMVTNSRSVGGFKSIIGKNVRFDDGVFEVTFVRLPKNAAELQEILAAIVLKEMDTHYMISFRTARLTIEAQQEIPWTLDGEYGGESQNVIIQNHQKALQIRTGN